jgi:hypothetical protein
MSITTFDYIPKIILGKTGNKLFNSINLVVRAIAFYIYFKTTDELDILELILAYVFPIIYILYKISQENTDYIGGLFSFGSSSGERCIERRGADLLAKKHGDRKSIPEDAKACGDVVLDTINTENECASIRSVGDSTDSDMYPSGVNACLYVPEEVDENVISHKSYECNVYNSRNRCNSQKDDDNNRLCQWGDMSTSTDCNGDLYKLGISENSVSSLTRNQCPQSCKFVRTAISPQSPSAAVIAGATTINLANVAGLLPGDTLTFADADSGSGNTCGLVPTTNTIESITGNTVKVTTAFSVGEDTTAHCTVTHDAPVNQCSNNPAGNEGVAGSRVGYCMNN